MWSPLCFFLKFFNPSGEAKRETNLILLILEIVNHNFKLKTELDMNSGTFLKSTNRQVHELGARLKQLENKLREFSN